eukprot:Gb_12108 [translate_table: standard]
MQTRRGSYSSHASQETASCKTRQGSLKRKPQILPEESKLKRKPQFFKEEVSRSNQSSKRFRPELCQNNGRDHFDGLPDDLVIAVFRCLSSTVSSPADFANAMLTCRRFCAIAMHPLVLVRAGRGTLAVKASRWSDGAHRFLKRCADVGNLEACYTLGMVRFYCFGNQSGGASLMAKAAMSSHAVALHSLAVIQFNGSGGSKKDKDLKAGVALCARAASLGQIDAMRDLGHCLQDGYGVQRNITEGRRLLLEANAREATAAGLNPPLTCLQNALKITSSSEHHLNNVSNVKKDSNQLVNPEISQHPIFSFLQRTCCSLLSDFGCNVPPAEPHIANKFLVDWFSLYPPPLGLRLCSNESCGRPETRRHEFRRCSACSSVNYCSRACQALDWKVCHRYVCMPTDDWDDVHGNDIGDEDFEEPNNS